MQTLFSVVLATRDRPALFEEALASVMAQTQPGVQIIVVNDGSSPDNLERYRPIWMAAQARLGERFQVHSLVHRPKGHGQSYSLNFGVAQADGGYVCFLDDDDKWTDPGHLARAAQVIESAAARHQIVDLYMTNQAAWIDDERPVGTLWLGDLAASLEARQVPTDPHGSYFVGVQDLLSSSGFCHLNCLVVRRPLFEQVGGMDEGIRWECDRDLYLKLIDSSQLMLHHPALVSYHRVPDPKKASNMTTTLGMIEKRLLQSIVLDRAALRSKHPAIREHAMRHKGYALRRIALELATSRDWSRANFYAWQALGAAPGAKWLLFSLQCMVRNALHRH